MEEIIGDVVKIGLRNVITIPKEVRDKLGLKIGDQLCFKKLEDGRVTLCKPEFVDLKVHQQI